MRRRRRTRPGLRLEGAAAAPADRAEPPSTLKYSPKAAQTAIVEPQCRAVRACGMDRRGSTNKGAAGRGGAGSGLKRGAQHLGSSVALGEQLSSMPASITRRCSSPASLSTGIAQEIGGLSQHMCGDLHWLWRAAVLGHEPVGSGECSGAGVGGMQCCWTIPENDRSDASKRRVLGMATADQCGWRAAVLGLRAVRVGALWVWGYS